MPPKRSRQRLAIFLDGTWNRRDDCTNVRHAFNLTHDGPVGDGTVVQRRYYDEGVGTGVLDGLTGGGFGLGLEGKVRDAYNWLVEHYEDGDEIFVFGFSRGAYTARSLVGLIGACGILRRGAPLTVTQLWDGYGILGRERENRTNWWEGLVGRRTSPFRPIRSLKWDPWHGGKVKSASRNLTEELLVTWSRRAKITFLGIFDTVGAMGWDALAIPGLRSKLSLHHNMRATTLIQRCRHALAIDENRSGFRQTPLLQYRDNGWDEERAARASRKWAGIEQRWFVGAHSNVGGGYPDNVLAARPLAWMLEGARLAGLVASPLHPTTGASATRRRDSYAEFAPPLWTQVIRAKRRYRRIVAPADVRASSRLRAGQGYSLVPIAEELDDSVGVLAAQAPDYAPPNLVEYAQRCCEEGSADPLLREIAARPPRHDWLGDAVVGRAALVAWCTIGALGMGALHEVFFGAYPEFAAHGWKFMATAAALVWIDWAEGFGALAIALRPDGPARRAFYDSAFWARFFSLTALATGLVAFVGSFLRTGWYAPSLIGVLGAVADACRTWWLVPVAAMAAALVVDLARRRLHLVATLAGGAAAGACLALAGLAVAGAVFWLGTGREVVPVPAEEARPVGITRLAGLLLLLQIGLAALARALRWVGLPLSRANLGSIVSLQRAWTPKRVAGLFQQWTSALERGWVPAAERASSAAALVRQLVREALWRDLVGLIPLYSLVLGLGLWIGATWIDGPLFSWLGAEPFGRGIPAWLLLVAGTALVDVLEDLVHLRHVTRHDRSSEPSRVVVALGSIAVLVKGVGFAVAVVTTMAVVAVASWQVITEPGGGWRKILAGGISMMVAVATLASAVAWGFKRVRGRRGTAGGELGESEPPSGRHRYQETGEDQPLAGAGEGHTGAAEGGAAS